MKEKIPKDRSYTYWVFALVLVRSESVENAYERVGYAKYGRVESALGERTAMMEITMV